MMSAAVSPPETDVVDSLSSLQALLDGLVSLPPHPPSLFLDVQGIRLGRNGSISIISLYVVPRSTVYLVDVETLRESTFSTTNSQRTSLKTVLESADIPKVCFDVRNSSNALFRLYEIALQGVHDLQLMELGSRRGSKAFVTGLAQCIEHDSTVPAAAKAEWRRSQDDVARRVDPPKGGRDAMAHERPLRPEMIHYCAQHVAFLPELYHTYDARLRPLEESFWGKEVHKATAARITRSQSPAYNPQDSDRARGPWNRQYIRYALEEWNNDIMLKTLNAL